MVEVSGELRAWLYLPRHFEQSIKLLWASVYHIFQPWKNQQSGWD